MFNRTFHPLQYLRRSSPQKFSLRLRHKLKQNEEKPPSKLAADVVNYLEQTPEYNEIKSKLPRSLLRKYKHPESMYLINHKTAKDLVNILKPNLNDDSPVIEVNPGLGFLSEQLLQSKKSKLYLFETSSHNHFSESITQLEEQYPGRLQYKVADFFGMWKLAFQDKMDQGSRVEGLLGDLATDDNDRIVKILGSMPGLSFVKHLINNIVFHNATNRLGRPDLYIIMPKHHYDLLTDDRIQFGKQRSIPTLFQLLFNYKVLSNVPKAHFLPWMHMVNSKKTDLMDEYFLYLVNITQKERLPCKAEHLPLLWYFFKPQVFSKSTRVIPMLEQWIPGCGMWLITGQDPPDTNKELLPGADDAQLPHMTIFTEFGDLDLRQKITVFKRFISWPEFEQCSFRVTMENNLPKSVVPVDDDDKRSLPSHIDDIADHTDSETEH